MVSKSIHENFEIYVIKPVVGLFEDFLVTRCISGPSKNDINERSSNNKNRKKKRKNTAPKEQEKLMYGC